MGGMNNLANALANDPSFKKQLTGIGLSKQEMEALVPQGTGKAGTGVKSKSPGSGGSKKWGD